MANEISTNPLPSPQMLTDQLKTSLTQVRPSCVAIDLGGYASGVIISPDGLVLSAAHIMRVAKDDVIFTITLADDTMAKAKLLGFNRETDYALLQITTQTNSPWPHCELADTTLLTSNFCFTVAHPAGYQKGHPAQVRLGRITSHSMRNSKPYFLFADCNIQPGDSGGPVFSMDGKLIALASSAANVLGFNLLPAIDQYHMDKERLIKGERWGDDNKAPDNPEFIQVELDENTLAMIQEEFMNRIQLNYPPTVEFIQSLVNTNGEVKLDQQSIVDHMSRDSISIARKQPICLGLDDNLLNQQLTPIPTNAPHAIPLYSDKTQIGYGLIYDDKHLVTKAGIITNNTELCLISGKQSISVDLVATNTTWDLALLEVTATNTLNPSKWLPSSKPVRAGDLLKANKNGRCLIWNVATDEARIVSKKRTIGPLRNKSLISKYRAPYPIAIRHALNLYAKDVGTPIFDKNSNFIGMHIARLTRTMGLIIPAKQLEEQTRKMINNKNHTRFPIDKNMRQGN